MLVSCWREAELASWSRLLRCKEEEYARRAAEHWFVLVRSLLTAPEVQGGAGVGGAGAGVGAGAGAGAGLAWPALGRLLPPWMHGPKSAQAAPANAANPTSTPNPNLNPTPTPRDDKNAPQAVSGGEYLSSVFSLADAFLRSCCVGEFPSRLHLVRIVASQMLLEAANPNSNPNPNPNNSQMLLEAADRDLTGGHADSKGGGISNSSSGGGSSTATHAVNPNPNPNPSSTATHALRCQAAYLLHGLWQYYSQFLLPVRTFQALLMGPLQAKLRDEAKISKWDQMTTYALVEHSERIHRKLNKLIRAYQADVLEHPMQAVLLREIQRDMTDDKGELVAATSVPAMSSIFPAGLGPAAAAGLGSSGAEGARSVFQIDTAPDVLALAIPAPAPAAAPRASGSADAPATPPLTLPLTLPAAVAAVYPRLARLPSLAAKMRSYLRAAMVLAAPTTPTLTLTPTAMVLAAPTLAPTPAPTANPTPGAAAAARGKKKGKPSGQGMEGAGEKGEAHGGGEKNENDEEGEEEEGEEEEEEEDNHCLRYMHRTRPALLAADSAVVLSRQVFARIRRLQVALTLT